jgi:hypothetical protein
MVPFPSCVLIRSSFSLIPFSLSQKSESLFLDFGKKHDRGTKKTPRLSPGFRSALRYVICLGKNKNLSGKEHREDSETLSFTAAVGQ